MSAFLVVAHPGHELFVYEWMRRARPVVHVLTDGSSRSGHARIEDCRAIVRDCGGTSGRLFGRFSDGQIYAWLLQGEFEPLLQWSHELAGEIIAARPRVLVGDAAERQYLTHDVCRLLVDAAVARACDVLGYAITRYAFPMYGFHGPQQALLPREEIVLELDEATLDAKQAAARSYTDTGLRTETDWFLDTRGREWFGVERLWDADTWHRASAEAQEAPAYEALGQRLVDQGTYERAIRYHEHVLPLARAVQQPQPGDVRCAS